MGVGVQHRPWRQCSARLAASTPRRRHATRTRARGGDAVLRLQLHGQRAVSDVSLVGTCSDVVEHERWRRRDGRDRLQRTVCRGSSSARGGCCYGGGGGDVDSG
jgi:hypothetical protein